MSYKTIILPAILTLEFFNFYSKKLIIAKLNNNFFYIFLPSFILFYKKKENIILFCFTKKFKDAFLNYSFFFKSWLKSIQRPIIRKLIFKGLGLKANINSYFLKNKTF